MVHHTRLGDQLTAWEPHSGQEQGRIKSGDMVICKVGVMR